MGSRVEGREIGAGLVGRGAGVMDVVVVLEEREVGWVGLVDLVALTRHFSLESFGCGVSN